MTIVQKSDVYIKMKIITEMKRRLTILIYDQNNYYSQGFSQGIKMHFAIQGQEINFTKNIFDKHHADIVFLSVDQNSFQFRYLSRCKTGPQHQRIFIIKDDIRECDRILFPRVDGILYRHQNLDAVINLVNLGIECTPKSAAYPRLSRREVEVMRGLLLGLPLNIIADKHQLSVKTISTHKRHAMMKLGISKSTDLNYWLLCGGLDQLPKNLLPNKLKYITNTQP
ncbi:response regulator transcription factor [Serratia proteamaculans]|uniref:response regulator transcription factor n=1 Tax=Serratia proteamaculans TaxID=28151 RepID=UPI0014325F7C|nr:LuxR C-terminal-related transcriptional regulator [Serratia proteamaculans]